MPAEPKPWVCPNCKAVLAEEQVRLDRPFVCRSCSSVIEHRNSVGGVGIFSCLVLVLVIGGGLIMLGLSQPVSLIGGITLGTLANFLLLNLILKMRSPRRELFAQQCMFDPKVAGELQKFMEMLATVQEWNASLELQRDSFFSQCSYDDSLENAALEAVDRFRALVRGEIPKRPGIRDLGVMRDELRAIASIIRHDLDRFSTTQ